MFSKQHVLAAGCILLGESCLGTAFGFRFGAGGATFFTAIALMVNMLAVSLCAGAGVRRRYPYPAPRPAVRGGLKTRPRTLPALPVPPGAAW